MSGERDEIDPFVMSVFRDSDKRVRRVPSSSEELAAYVNIDKDSASDFELVTYEARSDIVRDRLELMGFTLPTALRAFDQAIRVEESRHRERMESLRRQLGPDFTDEDGPALEILTAHEWVEGLRTVRERALTGALKSDVPDSSAIIRYMLAHQRRWFGFPGYDTRLPLRLAIEICREDQVVYDLTDLIGDVFDSSEPLIAHVDWLLSNGIARTKPLIVLTEGVTDKRAIERSIATLCPHLADNYRFMDFDGARVAGGAGFLAALVKAFVGAGIANRVIALFDNDTAATAAMRPLSQISLPPNIKVLQYATLPLASRYPTLGPSGIVVMDVNGLAGSIELYYGRDVLEQGTELVPVQWKGFDEGLRRYQDEITDKAGVQQRFDDKLRAAEAGPTCIRAQDWTGMMLILDQLRQAFHAQDAVEILELEGPWTP